MTQNELETLFYLLKKAQRALPESHYQRVVKYGNSFILYGRKLQERDFDKDTFFDTPRSKDTGILQTE